jgi:polysaccharide biosynthesis transport protein
VASGRAVAIVWPAKMLGPRRLRRPAVSEGAVEVEARDDVISFRDYFVMLNRQRLLILATVVLVLGAALGVSFAETPVYETSAQIIIDPVRRTQDLGLEDLGYQVIAVETERLVITSEPVAERAAEELELEHASSALAGVRVNAVPNTRVLWVTVSDTDPVAAARRANAVANAYLNYRREEAVESILAARAELERRAADLRREIDALDSTDDIDEIEREALTSRLSAVVSEMAAIGGTSAGVTGGGEVLHAAQVPRVPVSPRPRRTGAMALVLGLLLGVGFAFLRDHFDDVVRDEADFRRACGGRPVLGRIPYWDDPQGAERLATIVEPNSLASESYRELSASIRFLLLAHSTDAHDRKDRGGPGRSMMLASAVAGEGKTSTAANVAVAAARVGLKTLLIDTDLRRPTVHKRFGLGPTTGLTDALLSPENLHDHLISVGIDNLEVLPAGTLPPNPHELLASPAMRALHRTAALRADLVVYDTPAILAVPDALELARHVDVVLLVGRIASTGRRQVSAATERMGQVGAEVAGTVLNYIDSHTDYYYGYHGADREEVRRFRFLRRRSAERGLSGVSGLASGDRSGAGDPAASGTVRVRTERTAPARGPEDERKQDMGAAVSPGAPVSASNGPGRGTKGTGSGAVNGPGDE